MKITELTESIQKYPRDKKDFKALEDILSTNIVGESGLALIQTVIDDNELNDNARARIARDQNSILNDLVVDWVRTNIPHIISPVDPEKLHNTSSVISTHPSNINKEV
jgi:hypothetical protein